jgi:hypothetical protein
MPAQMDWFLDTGGSDTSPGTSTNLTILTKLRFKTEDGFALDSANPIPRPGAAATNHSFWRNVYLECIIAPTTSLNNVQWFTDGVNNYGTDVNLSIGDETPEKSSGSSAGYVAATGTPGLSGNELVTNNAQITGKVNAFTFTSGVPKTVTITDGSGTITSVGETTDYIVLQMDVTENAVPGATGVETLTFQYDES